MLATLPYPHCFLKDRKASRNYFMEVTLKCRLSFELARGYDEEDDVCVVEEGKQLITKGLVI